MNDATSDLIAVKQLKIGMFVELDLGWMAHPFPTGSFKIASEKQIEIIHGLGLTRVRYVPGQSDLTVRVAPVIDVLETLPGHRMADETGLDVAGDGAEAGRFRNSGVDLLAVQQHRLRVCERRCGKANRLYKTVVEQVNARPETAMAKSFELINSWVLELSGDGESAIRLLSESMGDKAAMHPVNVTILSLLLGQSLGLTQSEMVDLGMAAFLHDIGKTQLPDRVRWLDENFSSAEYNLYQMHVDEGVALGVRMGLTPGALQAMAQHHELSDGSGFPARLMADQLALPSRILALVNRYENLCNPNRPTTAVTPHEALSLIFAQWKTRFDSVVINAFIRMMGVYPPGSVVQLVDERFALVVSVNSSRPLKPRVMVYDPGVPRHEALVVDLEQAPNLGIRRSLKPATLPKAAMDYLSPRQRICYFFERAIDLPAEGSA